MDKSFAMALVTGILTLIGTLCGAGFIQFLITRKDNKTTIIEEIKKAIDDVKNKMDYIDQGNVRQQIMMLIHLYPKRTDEIMKLGRKYFIEFGGNYYLTSIFKEWMDTNNLIYPLWWDDIKQ